MLKIFVTVVLGMLLFTAYSQENTQWRGEARDGVYHETGLLKEWPEAGPELIWKYDDLGEGHSSVSISDDKIYITGLQDSTGVLYVLDMNGQLLDSKRYGLEWYKNFEGPRASVVVNDQKLYVYSGMGQLICYDQESLEEIWSDNILRTYGSKNITWGVNESAVIVDEKIYITPGGDGQSVIALNKNTGDLIWKSEAQGGLSAYCSPQYISDQDVPLLVTMTADNILGVHAETGEILWSHEQKNRWSVHANTPLYSDGYLLNTSGYGKGSSCLKLNDGGRSVEQVWFADSLDNRMGGIVEVDGYYYGSGDKNRFWFCIEQKTGKVQYRAKGLAIGNIITADGMLYCYSDKGELALVRATPEKFDVVSKFKIKHGTKQHWAHPVIRDGVLYVRHGSSLMAYKIK